MADGYIKGDFDSAEPLEGSELSVDTYHHPNIPLTPDQELRMRCVEAAALAVSGCTFTIQGETVKQIADVLERHVKGG